MSLDIMNFRIASVLLLAVWTASMGAQGYDHETLSTVTGRVYREIFVIGSDAHGLTFRHRDGIAKLPFGDLSTSYRMLYEPVADLEEAVPDAAELAEASDEVNLPLPVTMQARTRITIHLPPPVWRLGGGMSPAWVNPVWPSWWPRHQEVHRLSHPLYREMVVRDFLHSSGLLHGFGYR